MCYSTTITLFLRSMIFVGSGYSNIHKFWILPGKMGIIIRILWVYNAYSWWVSWALHSTPSGWMLMLSGGVVLANMLRIIIYWVVIHPTSRAQQRDDDDCGWDLYRGSQWLGWVSIYNGWKFRNKGNRRLKATLIVMTFALHLWECA